MLHSLSFSRESLSQFSFPIIPLILAGPRYRPKNREHVGLNFLRSLHQLRVENFYLLDTKPVNIAEACCGAVIFRHWVYRVTPGAY